jgi:hypothetical protein
MHASYIEDVNIPAEYQVDSLAGQSDTGHA